MKVNIGPYRDWVGPYHIANAIFFWVRDVDQYDPLELDFNRWDYRLRDKFGDWLASTWVQSFCEWIDKFKQRKVKIHIDPYDTWSMDHTLALIIHPMLIQLKDKNHGYFNSDPEDAPHIGQEPGADFTNDAKALDRYNWIMDELIWTFDQLANSDSEYKFYKDGEWDMEACQKHHDRISNGLRLFGKYYRGLWD
jgi:hypothetical protein